ncbi:BCSC C-terminal domain-containing protein [Burkholderia pseudomallei]|uniref:Cellulose synthase operon protein C n=1 Tax=Burkholderia pseudomallei (strain 1106a) TaxID=357348 RepID=A3P767_BURP0|nr:putative cellulose synthase operon protein C [Burkholderia pseudomallei 1106a]KGC79655.1 cellulose synthase operon C family protein [Burkholderia pseudomallei]MBF3680278.1 BCSC C-terminal domain-containing protein [Burkholderia pseudomallei]MBF3821625.1 BCSC C-terminal domain-containing protein [Burkholderia pseudomallei]MBF3937847.1 BCSC C-terminal domain-containing protein [Burkholderia pseudomallei]
MLDARALTAGPQTRRRARRGAGCAGIAAVAAIAFAVPCFASAAADDVAARWAASERSLADAHACAGVRSAAPGWAVSMEAAAPPPRFVPPGPNTSPGAMQANVEAMPPAAPAQAAAMTRASSARLEPAPSASVDASSANVEAMPPAAPAQAAAMTRASSARLESAPSASVDASSANVEAMPPAVPARAAAMTRASSARLEPAPSASVDASSANVEAMPPAAPARAAAMAQASPVRPASVPRASFDAPSAQAGSMPPDTAHRHASAASSPARTTAPAGFASAALRAFAPTYPMSLMSPTSPKQTPPVRFVPTSPRGAPATPQPVATPHAPDADAVRALYATARMWANKHRDDLARDALRKALLIAPRDPALLAEHTRILLRVGDAKGARASLERLKQAAPGALATRQVDDEYRVATSGREEMAQIRLLARSGRGDEAARRIVALFPHGAPAGSLGAEYYQIVASAPDGRARAIDALRRAVAADPADADAATVLAKLLNQRDDTRAQANRLAWALVARPDTDRRASLALWRSVLQSAGRDLAYLDALRAYLTFVPEDDEFRGNAAALEQQRDARLRLARDPDYIAQQRGLQALARGDPAAAEPLLARAAAARAGDPDALGGLGLLRLRQGRHDEARALFVRAAALAPDNRAKWVGLAGTARFWGTLAQGRAAAAQGRPDDAQRAARAALALDPQSADAKLLLADSLLARRDWRAAQPLLRALLDARAPSMSAVRSMRTLYEQTGRADAFGPLVDALQSRFAAPDDRAALSRLRAEWLAQQADALAAAGQRGPAAQRYEASLRIAPDAPWARFALARLYRDMGLPQLGRAVMDEGLAGSDAADMRYAAALYRYALDDVAGARAAFAAIADASRTQGMRAFARKLDAEAALADARAALAREDRAAAHAALERARRAAPDDPDMLAAVGAQWIDIGEIERGLAPLRDWIVAHPREADADVRLRYGDLLGGARRDDALAAWLDTLRRGGAPLDAAQSARLEDQALRLVLRETDDALDRDDYEAAARALDRASPAGKADRRYALEAAELARAQGRYDTARAALAPLLARAPDDADAQLALARILDDDGAPADALALVRDVLARTPPDDVDTQLSALRRLTALRRARDAAALADTLRAAYPARADVTVAAGRVAQALGRYDDAASLYRLSLAQERATGIAPRRDGATPAQAAWADLQQRRDPQIEAGWLPAYKSGDEGVSAYRAHQMPVYLQMPYRYDGHAFVHLDAVRLDAGTLDTSDPRAYAFDTFATHPALADAAAPGGALRQRAAGIGGGIGYRDDAWRVDVGTTPLGFPVHYVVGGVRYRFGAGPASVTVSAARRPETGSMLSYAGLRDPWTGATWGGVRRDSVGVRASVDIGRVNLFADLAAARLTGRNVAENAAVTLRTGFMAPVYRRADMRVSAGLVGNAWHYAQNLRYYTYGQGGYYSPQRYLSIGMPLEWAGRRGAFTWDVTATVGVSNSYERDSPYFPNGLPGSTLVKSAPALGNPVFSRGSTRGVSFWYGFAGVAEYRVNGRLAVGARFDIDHAHDYAPSAGLLYVRYAFDARKDSGGFSPSPVRLYSSY